MLKAKFRKLSKIPQDEFIFRFKEKLIETSEIVLHILGCDKLSNEKWINNICNIKSSHDPDKELFKSFLNGKRDRFFTEGSDKIFRLDLIKNYFNFDNWISEAEDILNGDITLLGQHLKIPVGKGWNTDPLKGIYWPKIFYNLVRSSKKIQACDIKYIWEINRHQYLIILAKAYWLTGCEKYAEKVFTIIEDWIAENPYHSGVNWTSSLELAVRSISWIWALFLCKESKHLRPQTYLTFSKSIYEHAKHIENHLSYYSSPYNHLIGEAAALHIIGSLFPQFKNSKKWEQLGWNILLNQIEKQFYSDGMCVEQAMFYHHFTLGFYLQAIFLRRLNKKNIPKKILSCLEKALEFSMYITKPDGTIPMIGDIDNARSLYFTSSHSWNFQGFLGLGAVLFNRLDFKHQSSNLSEELFWLGDNQDIKKFMNMKSISPSKSSIALHNSGYYIFRDLWNKQSHYLCFDCGEIADGLFKDKTPSAAHGHADALSFQLSAFGKSFLVDSGFYTYFGDEQWHKYYRCEEAHNTLKINNFRQAQYCGHLKWNQALQPFLEKWDATQDYDFISAQLDYSENIYHNRKILYLKKNFWFFLDYIESNGENFKIESYFHFDPSVDLLVDEKNKRLIAFCGDIGILIKYFNNVKVCFCKKGDKPSDGWVSTGYGIRQPAWTIQLIWNSIEHNGLFPFIIIPWEKEYDYIQIDKWSWKDNENNLFSTSLLKSDNDDYFTIAVKKNFKIQLINNNVNFIDKS